MGNGICNATYDKNVLGLEMRLRELNKKTQIENKRKSGPTRMGKTKKSKKEGVVCMKEHAEVINKFYEKRRQWLLEQLRDLEDQEFKELGQDQALYQHRQTTLQN